jgi:hypothetical protein
LFDVVGVVILVVCTVGAARSWLYRPAHDRDIAGADVV